jgi:hypothetical protein
MSIRGCAALVAASGCLVVAPVAIASGSGPGNTSGTNGTSVSAGGAASGVPSGGGNGGTASGGSSGGGQVSGNNTAAPPPTCTITSFKVSTVYDPQFKIDDVSLAYSIPAGCPNHSSWQIVYTNDLTGQTAQLFGTTGAAPSGNANAVTPGVTATTVIGTSLLGTPVTFHMEIDTLQGQLITSFADQSLTTASAS